MSSAQLVSSAMIARMLGCTAKHVRRLIEDGLPVEAIGKGRAGHKFDLHKVHEWDKARSQVGTPAGDLAAARIRAETARAEKLERENLVAKRELLLASEVQVTSLAAIAALNSRMEGSPNRLAAEVEHKPQAAARQIILEEHREIRRKFANDLEVLSGKIDDEEHLEEALELIASWISHLKDGIGD